MSEKKGTIRQMFKQLGTGLGAFLYSQGTIATGTASGQGWEYIPQSGAEVPVLVNRTYIDLSGYTQQELTMFTQAVDFQKNTFSTAIAASGAQPVSVIEYDLLTTRRIRTAELTDILNAPPSFLPSTLDLMECIYGEQVTNLQNTNIPGAFVPTYADTFGSGNPTASDKLHWTRIILAQPGATPQEQPITITANLCNLVVGGITMEEKDLVYIERLRRAYTQERP